MGHPLRQPLPRVRTDLVQNRRYPRQRRGSMGKRVVVRQTRPARVPLPTIPEVRQIPGTGKLVVTRPSPKIVGSDLRQIPGTEYLLKS
jgi:hypothetical protein